MLPRFSLLLLLFIPIPAIAQGLATVASYTSSLDDSTQQYGIYVPHNPPPAKSGYPAIFHAHGYGWSVNANFSDFQRQWAERHGWILINLNARGPQFYEGVGDVESRNVIRDANRRFGLDLSRLFITGGSMGGTGAFRLAIRYPDLFAAAVGVDGWSDYREWHHHWYARTDQRSDIEEFRRPLLEACSPLYWTGRARWGQVQASVSGQDTVVLPINGLSLYNALLERANNMPGAYESRLFLDDAAGHGGSTRMDQIYNFFANREALSDPVSFLCESSVLTHGNLYWGSFERLAVQGAMASLESDTAGDTVTVITRNLAQFALHLQASPVAGQRSVRVYVDGFPCYQGRPRTVHLEADLSPTGQLWGWHEREPQGLQKTPALEGPIGEAFKVPFVVVYGTAGTPRENEQNEREATAFAGGWNGFMVHADALTPIPEDRLSAPDLQSRSLILFGTETSSALLRQANARHELPVHVRGDRITVADPKWGDREYLGDQFGAFLCYPNPLSNFSTYLVVCHGQWATKPDGTNRQGLEYDLEKLPWAYSDYVVFNTNQSELPHVLNVNDKPPVTCYEAGYFVEAGYFDQDWQPYRMATLDRLNALKLPTRRISVTGMSANREGVTVRIADASGAPVHQARVTVRFSGNAPTGRSGVTGEDGTAFFAYAAGSTTTPPACEIVNVMATGAEYDFTADLATDTGGQGLGLAATAAAVDENGRATINAQATAQTPALVTVSAAPTVGQVYPPEQKLQLASSASRKLSFLFEGAGLPAGEYPVQVLLRCDSPRVSAVRTVHLRVGRWAQSPLRVAEIKPTDIAAGKPWQVTARLMNYGPKPVTADVCCALIEDRKYLPARRVTVRPQEPLDVIFAAESHEPPLPLGMHSVRVSVLGHTGATGTADFSVK